MSTWSTWMPELIHLDRSTWLPDQTSLDGLLGHLAEKSRRVDLDAVAGLVYRSTWMLEPINIDWLT